MLQAIVLGAAQGLTEFVPVSSSAHLVLLPFLLRWRIPSLAFDVAIHLGTLVALLVYFAPDLLRMLAGATRAAVGRGNEGDHLQGRLVLLLAAGTVPAAAVGFFLEGFVEDLFERPAVTAALLLGTAVLIVSAEAVNRRRPPERRRDMAGGGWRGPGGIGPVQGAGLGPGVPRPGGADPA